MKLKKTLIDLYKGIRNWFRGRDLGIAWIVLIILRGPCRLALSG